MRKRRDRTPGASGSISGEPTRANVPDELLQELLADAAAVEGKATDPSFEEEAVDTFANDDPWQGPSCLPPPLERLLLGIIRAHPDKDEHDFKRLDRAMKALVGRKASRFVLAATETGKITGKDKDLDALDWMHEQMQQDAWRQYGWRAITEPSLRPKLRSVLSLAQEAAQKFYPSVDFLYTASVENKLRNKFNGHLGSMNKVKTSFSVKSFIGHDWVKESLETQSLKAVREQMRNWNIKIIPDWEED